MPELSVTDFLRCCVPSNNFDVQTFQAVRSMLNLDAATNTHPDPYETEEVVLDFFCTDEDTVYDWLQGSAFCQPFRSFSNYYLRFTKDLTPWGGLLPFPQNDIPVTDAVHALTMELLTNFDVKLQLTRYFAVLNDAFVNPRDVLDYIKRNHASLYAQFTRQHAELAMQATDVSLYAVMNFDYDESTIGPEKMIGYGLLFGVRAISLILAHIVRLGCAVSFNLFISQVQTTNYGKMINYCPGYYDQATMQFKLLGNKDRNGNIDNRCFLTEYFKAVLNFLKFDYKYRPNISYQVYVLIMDVVYKIGPVLSEYELVYGWKNREYNPCREIRSVVHQIIGFSYNLMSYLPELFCYVEQEVFMEYLDFDENAVNYKLDELSAAISAFYNDAQSEYLSAFFKQIIRQAILNSDNYILAFGYVLGLRDNYKALNELYEQLVYRFTYNNRRCAYYLYSSFVQNFIPANVRFFVAAMRFARFLYSDEVHCLEIEWKQLAAARRGCCSAFLVDDANVFYAARAHIEEVTAELSKPIQQVNGELFVNLCCAVVEFVEQALVLHNARDCGMELLARLQELTEDYTFVQMIQDLFKDVSLIDCAKMQQITRLKRVELEILAKELDTFSAVCQQRVPELRDMVGYFAHTPYVLDYSKLERFYLQPDDGTYYWFANFMAHTSSCNMMLAKKVENGLLFVDDAVELPNSDSKLGALTLVFQLAATDNLYTVVDTYYACQLGKSKTFRLLNREADETAIYAIYVSTDRKMLESILGRYYPARPCVLYNGECNNCDYYAIAHYDSVSGVFDAFLKMCYDSAGIPIQTHIGTYNIRSIVEYVCRKFNCTRIVADQALYPLLSDFHYEELSEMMREILIKYVVVSNTANCQKMLMTYLKTVSYTSTPDRLFERLLSHYAEIDQENEQLAACLRFLRNQRIGLADGLQVSQADTQENAFVYVTSDYAQGARFLPKAIAVVCFKPPLSLPAQPAPDLTFTMPALTLQQFCEFLFLRASRVKAGMEGETADLRWENGVVMLNYRAIATTTQFVFSEAHFNEKSSSVAFPRAQLYHYVKAFFDLNLCKHDAMNTLQSANPANLRRVSPCRRVVLGLSEADLGLLTSYKCSDTYFVQTNDKPLEIQLFLYFSEYLKDDVCPRMSSTYKKQIERFINTERDFCQRIVYHYVDENPSHPILKYMHSLFSGGEVGTLLDYVPNMIIGTQLFEEIHRREGDVLAKIY